MVYVYLFTNYFSMINIKRLLVVSVFFTLFFSANAIAQKINQLNSEGKRVGVWRKFYDNGKIRYQGQFENGKEVGVFKFYKNIASTQPAIVKEFLPNSNKASVKFYDSNGKLKSAGEMIGKNRVGKWMYYFSDGKPLSEELYTNGKLNGLLKNYYPNGKTTEETIYKNGKKHGVSKIYANDGVLIEEVNYSYGKLNGQAKYFDLKGNLTEKGTYANGRRSSDWEYYSNGEVTNKRKRKTHLIDKK